jgi:hypothetical protein
MVRSLPRPPTCLQPFATLQLTAGLRYHVGRRRSSSICAFVQKCKQFMRGSRTGVGGRGRIADGSSLLLSRAERICLERGACNNNRTLPLRTANKSLPVIRCNSGQVGCGRGSTDRVEVPLHPTRACLSSTSIPQQVSKQQGEQLRGAEESFQASRFPRAERGLNCA